MSHGESWRSFGREPWGVIGGEPWGVQQKKILAGHELVFFALRTPRVDIRENMFFVFLPRKVPCGKKKNRLVKFAPLGDHLCDLIFSFLAPP